MQIIHLCFHIVLFSVVSHAAFGNQKIKSESVEQQISGSQSPSDPASASNPQQQKSPGGSTAQPAQLSTTPCSGFCSDCGFCPGLCISAVCYPFPPGMQTPVWVSPTTKTTTTTSKPSAMTTESAAAATTQGSGSTLVTTGPCPKPVVFENPATPPSISMACLTYPVEYKSYMDACLAYDAFMSVDNRMYFPYCCRKWLARGCFGDIEYSMHW